VHPRGAVGRDGTRRQGRQSIPWAAGDGLSKSEQADEGRRRERKESERSHSLKQEEARRRESSEEERREKRGKEE
jgi:hypothetical protein